MLKLYEYNTLKIWKKVIKYVKIDRSRFIPNYANTQRFLREMIFASQQKPEYVQRDFIS